MELTHLGHACLLVEVAGQRILLDPGTFSTVSQVRDLSAVVVTHQHADHLDLEAFGPLLEANPDAVVLLEPQAAEVVTRAVGSDRPIALSAEAVLVGEVTLTPVGERHAEIHAYLPRIDNRGIVVSAEGEPTLFHPGDALDAEPGEVDVLCVPVNAPWGKVGETVEFVRRIGAPRVVPIHDGLLNDTGRGMYLKHIADFGADGGVEVLDLRGAGRTTL